MIMRKTAQIYRSIYKLVFILILLISFGFIFDIYAQEPPAKHTTRITFETTQKNNGEIVLKGILKARVGRSYTNISGLPLSFYSLYDGEENQLEEIETNLNGEAEVLITSDAIHADTSGAMHYLIRFEGNDTLRSRESETTIYQGKLEMEGTEEDSVYYVDLTVNQIKGSARFPYAGVDVSLYVPRLFSNLKIGEGTTDANGVLRIGFPQYLRGDVDGLINILAIVEENEQFGNLEANMEQNWGIPLVRVAQQTRTLWSPDPPIWMVITFILMIGAVWGHYIVIVYKLILIKKKKGQILET